MTTKTTRRKDEAMTRPTITLAAFENVALTDGAWRFDPFKRVQVWVPASEAADPKVAPRDIIACPKCEARADEQCRTPGGKSVRSHAVRASPRVCSCGGRIKRGRRLCDECFAENQRMSQKLCRERAAEAAA